MSMTIKQIADSIGVSKTAIRKKIDDSFRESYTSFNNAGVILISDEGCKLLIDSFCKQPETKEKFAETKEELIQGKEKFAETQEKILQTENAFAETQKKFPQTEEKLAETNDETISATERFVESERKFSQTSENHTENQFSQLSVNDESWVSARLVEMLQEQLNIKDRQIAELNARLAETTLALTETQRSLQAAQALHAGTIQQSLETAVEQHPYTESDIAVSAERSKKRSFFSRFVSIFNGKR